MLFKLKLAFLVQIHMLYDLLAQLPFPCKCLYPKNYASIVATQVETIEKQGADRRSDFIIRFDDFYINLVTMCEVGEMNPISARY